VIKIAVQTREGIPASKP